MAHGSTATGAGTWRPGDAPGGWSPSSGTRKQFVLILHWLLSGDCWLRRRTTGVCGMSRPPECLKFAVASRMMTGCKTLRGLASTAQPWLASGNLHACVMALSLWSPGARPYSRPPWRKGAAEGARTSNWRYGMHACVRDSQRSGVYRRALSGMRWLALTRRHNRARV